MRKRINFSLILATYGRHKEIKDFLDSICRQEYSLEEVEVIVVDQNDKIKLDELIENYRSRINITHIKSNIKGLSVNRNIGLDLAKGSIVAFPDDDCTYYPDTLRVVANLFKESPNTDIFMGSIFDRETSSDVLRKWPKKRLTINKWNFFRLISSITIFSKINSQRFDAELGVGGQYGSNEDADYIYRSLKQGAAIIYDSDLTIWHPEQNDKNISKSKAYSYGLGFGALIAKHYTVDMHILFIKSIAFHALKLTSSLIKFNIKPVNMRVSAISSRISGYFTYKKHRG